MANVQAARTEVEAARKELDKALQQAVNFEEILAVIYGHLGNALDNLRDEPAGGASPLFAWPTDFKTITQGWGLRPDLYRKFNMRGITHPPHDGHEGIDVRTGTHGRVYCIAPGTVYEVAERGNYGYHIRVEHRLSNGLRLRSIYAHMASGTAMVKDGDRVTPGRLLGYSGKTGNIDGEHLHLSVYQLIDGKWLLVDPMLFLKEPFEAA